MIDFFKKDDKLILSYVPDIDSNENWVNKVLEEDGEVTLKKTFFTTAADEYFNADSKPERVDEVFDTEPEAVAFVV